MNLTLPNIINIIQLVSLIIFTNYIYRLEEIECKCSKNWTRDFIKYYSIIMIVISIYISFYLNFGKTNSQFENLIILVNICNLFFIYTLWKYNKFLCKRECECSSGWEKDFMTFYTFTIMIILSIQIVSSLMSSMNSKKPLDNIKKEFLKMVKNPKIKLIS